MVTRKFLEEKGFDQIDELFDDIIDKKSNNNDGEAIELFSVLSDAQKKKFHNYLEVLYHYDQDDPIELHELLNFFGYDRV